MTIMLYQTINTNKLQKTSYISFHCTSFIIIIVILKKLDPRLPPEFISGDFHPPRVFFPINETGVLSPCVVVPPSMMVQKITEKKPRIPFILGLIRERSESTTKPYSKESNKKTGGPIVLSSL
ncbi:hypothetical protein H8356DRAFT_1330202 [Neocallimastix lanati (nom. inval.)]|nr:hypothetical protein H8356DRAFT_1330202 [Neocallimastix sp. JGI-2020a]